MILKVVIVVVVLIVIYPFVNWFMTQIIFKSKRRTRERLFEAYKFYRKKYANASEKELLFYVMKASFTILDREPDSSKPARILTKKDVEGMVEETSDIDSLIKIVIERGLSPDLAPWP